MKKAYILVLIAMVLLMVAGGCSGKMPLATRIEQLNDAGYTVGVLTGAASVYQGTELVGYDIEMIYRLAAY